MKTEILTKMVQEYRVMPNMSWDGALMNVMNLKWKIQLPLSDLLAPEVAIGTNSLFS